MNEPKEFVPLWLSYEAYFEPLSDEETGRLIRAMLAYKSTGVDPALDGNERFIWPAIKRDIDSAAAAHKARSETQSTNGRKGGRPGKSTGRKKENPSVSDETQKSHGFSENPSVSDETQKSDGFSENPSVSEETQKSDGFSENPSVSEESQKSYRKRNVKEKNKETTTTVVAKKPLLSLSSSVSDDVQVVLDEYRQLLNPHPSPASLTALEGFVNALSAEVCIHAIHIAADANKRGWSYLRGILAGYQRKKLHSMEDVLAAEQVHDRQKSADAVPAPAPHDPHHVDSVDDWQAVFARRPTSRDSPPGSAISAAGGALS